MACIKRNIYLFYLYFEGRKMIFEAIRTKVTISTRGGSRDFAKGAGGAICWVADEENVWFHMV